MSALIAFEAAARCEGFKAAAQELNVTPAAISHQVKALEAELSCALFQRHHRGVDLTETGAYLLVALQRGFEGIDEAVDQLRRRSNRASVTIRLTTAVSSLWLTPKLAQFWKSHADISLAQVVSDIEPDIQDCDDDMGAVLGWVGLTQSYRDRGQLVPLLPLEVEDAKDFYVKLHPHASARARLVYDWLVETSARG
ncbi:MAG: LysR family transcriptional regulator [Maritimibacter sp.]